VRTVSVRPRAEARAETGVSGPKPHDRAEIKYRETLVAYIHVNKRITIFLFNFARLAR
jgi:hypothetical protein